MWEISVIVRGFMNSPVYKNSASLIKAYLSFKLSILLSKVIDKFSQTFSYFISFKSFYKLLDLAISGSKFTTDLFSYNYEFLKTFFTLIRCLGKSVF